MKKHTLTKTLLLAAVIGGLTFVPGNIDFTYGYGESASLPGSTTLPKECNQPKPASPTFFQPTNAGSGAVNLKWVKTTITDKYTIGYGVSSGNYIYGVSDTGNTDNYTIGYLNSGKRYYFAVRGVNDCTPGAWSQEQSIVIGGGSGNLLAGNFNSPQDNSEYEQPYSTPTPAYMNNLPSTMPQNDVTNYQAPTMSQPAISPPAPAQAPVEEPGIFEKIVNFFKGLFGL